MKTKVRVSIALFVMLSIFVGQGSAQPLGRYIVTIQGPAEQAEAAVVQAGGVVSHAFELIPAIAIQVPEAALQGLQRNPLFVSIEPDVVVTAFLKPDANPGKGKKPGGGGGGGGGTTTQTLPWGVDRIDAECVWTTATGVDVKVAVLDTGIDYTHPDLADNCKGGINIINSRKDYMDDNGHGTHVAGIIAAEDNSIGVVGVAPDASLYAVKALDRNGSGWLSDIIAGLDWCVNNQIDVVNMSLGTNSDVQALHDECDAVAAAGLFLVAAAGNDSGAVDYPAAYTSVIAVSATDSSDHLAYFSSRGIEIEVAAPGVSIFSTYMGGGYATLSGTSMAAPHVTGTLALNPSADLCKTAETLQNLTTEEQGCGLVDAQNAATGSSSGDNLP